MKPSAELLLGLVLATLAAVQAPPEGLDPANYPASDAHEGVTLAAKPYLEAAGIEARFGVHALAAAGLVPVEVLVVNQRDAAIRVAWQRATLLNGDEPCESLDPERAAVRVYPLPKPEAPPWPGRRRTKPPADKKREAREALQAALTAQSIRLKVAAAGSRLRGFLYFACGESPVELAHARLYVPEVVRLPGEEPLMFFEVEFKAAGAP